MHVVLISWPSWLKGARVTIELTVLSAAFSLLLSLVFGVLSTQRNIVSRTVSRVFIELFRGVAALVLLFWFFNALPLVGVRLNSMTAAVLALGLNVGAYGAESVRGAILAVPRTQWEATVALNLTIWQRLRLVILPQAWAAMLPPFGNLLIQLFKATALVSLIGVVDLTRVAQNARSNSGNAAVSFFAALILYFVIAQLMIAGMRYLERRSNIRLGRRPTRRRGVAPEPKLIEFSVPSAPGGDS